MKNTVKLNKSAVQQIKSVLLTLPDTQWCECLQKLCNRMKLCDASKELLDQVLIEMRKGI